MNIQVHTRRFHHTVVALTISWFLVMVFVANAVWPYFNARLEAWLHPVVSLCGCDQLMGWPDQPTLFIGMTLILLVFIGLVVRASVRLIITIWRTNRYHRYLLKHSFSTTQCAGIIIHQVALAEPIALSIGYFQPAIFVSTGVQAILQPFELWAVIRHELSHALQRDPLHRLGMSAVQPLFPLFRKQFDRYQAWQELAADEYVSDDHTIRQALVKLVSAQSPQPQVSATWFSTTNARIDRLLGTNIALPKLWPLVMMTIVLAVALLSTTRVFAQEEQVTAYGQCVSVQPMCEAVMSYVLP